MQKDSHENLRVVLNVVRRVTKAIKIFPFVYILILLLFLPTMSYLDIDTATILSGCIFESPLLIALLILLSYSVKLCIWHRIQCLLPLVPQVADFVDTHIYEYGEALATLNFIVLLLLFILSLVNAYFVFIKPTTPNFSIRPTTPNT